MPSGAGSTAGTSWGDGAAPRPLCSSQRVRAGPRARRLLWGKRRGFITLPSFTTAAFPLINPPLCPCAQRKAFQIACAVNFISAACLLVSLPTQNEQPDSRKLIRRRARSSACQQPVACEQPPPELCQSTSVHCREEFLMPQTDT